MKGSWTLSEEEILGIFDLAMRTERMGEFTFLYQTKAEQCLKVLMEKHGPETMNRLLENVEWKECFVTHFMKLLQIIQRNTHLHNKPLDLMSNDEIDQRIIETLFSEGTVEDISFFERISRVDW